MSRTIRYILYFVTGVVMSQIVIIVADNILSAMIGYVAGALAITINYLIAQATNDD